MYIYVLICSLHIRIIKVDFVCQVDNRMVHQSNSHLPSMYLSAYCVHGTHSRGRGCLVPHQEDLRATGDLRLFKCSWHSLSCGGGCSVRHNPTLCSVTAFPLGSSGLLWRRCVFSTRTTWIASPQGDGWERMGNKNKW